MRTMAIIVLLGFAAYAYALTSTAPHLPGCSAYADILHECDPRR